ncbi:Protein TIC 22, chloroplastic [Vitis vinifera]|uniref:Protein TIC 22, chloroplastic n=2 Tax=Vitis vinifera TaxID=29760 RepID=A0A438ITH1_VITVI|nr:Protein TIC 22, chloroplastic [Vitis vinifera]
MEPPKPSNPLLSFSTFIHQHCLRLGAELASRLDDTRRLAGNWPPPALRRSLPLSSLPFASMSQEARGAKRDLGVALSSDHVAKSLAGTAVYTVSNSNNEFVLISDPNGIKSIGLLCFRQEDAEAFLAQVQSRTRELRSQARVVPISLDQVYIWNLCNFLFSFRFNISVVGFCGSVMELELPDSFVHRFKPLIYGNDKYFMEMLEMQA